jgi:hypothetical protein
MPLKKTGLFPNMPRRDRVVLAASAFLYLSGQICEALLDWSGLTTEVVALLAVSAGLIYVLALVFSTCLS